MRFLKRLVLAGVAALGIGAAATPADAQQQRASLLDDIFARGELRVGWSTYYPHLYRNPQTNEIEGISADILALLAERLGVKLVMVEDSWATMIAGLQAGRYDMTPPATGISLPRAVAITYTQPVFRTPIGLMVRADDAQKWADAKALDEPGVRISTTLGSSTDMFVTGQYQNAEILRVKSDADSITQLMTRRAEAWASTIDAFEEVAQEHPNLVPLENGLIGFTYMSVAVPRGEYHWRDYLNYFIDEIQDQGTLASIFAAHGLPESYLIQP